MSVHCSVVGVPPTTCIYRFYLAPGFRLAGTPTGELIKGKDALEEIENIIGQLN
jgi:hypothetical protein